MAEAQNRICPKCRRPPQFPQQLVCAQCREPFVDQSSVSAELSEEDLKRVAEHVIRSLHPHDVENIAKALMGIPRFWIILILVLAVLAFLLFELGGYEVRKAASKAFQEEVAKQITEQFKEPRISNVVLAVSRERATYLMSRQIQPSIDRFSNGLNLIQLSLSNTQYSAEKKLVEIRSLVEAFSSPTEEVVQGTDRSRLVFRQDCGCAMVILNGLPVAHTTRITAMDNKGAQTIGAVSEVLPLNLAIFTYAGNWTEWTNLTYYINYVKDPREPPVVYVSSLSFETNALVLNGIRLPFSFLDSLEPMMSQVESVVTNRGLFGIKHLDSGLLTLIMPLITGSKPPPNGPSRIVDLDPRWFRIVSNIFSLQVSNPPDKVRVAATNSSVRQPENDSK